MARELNRAQQKAQKKKVIILVVMVLAAGATWSKNLFGKGDKPSPSTSPTPAAAANAASPPAASGAAASVATTSSITTFDQAVARMDLWPTALDRQVHAGTIEELTPINDLLEGPEPIEEEEPEAIVDLTPVLQPMLPPEPEDPTIAFDDLRLKLTTTARFGKSTYAVINGQRVRGGETVEVQVDGETIRYEVRAIGTREVEVAYAGGVHVLRIGLAGFDTREQEGA